MMDQFTETAENSDISLLLHLDELPERTSQTVKFSGRCEAVLRPVRLSKTAR